MELSYQLEEVTLSNGTKTLSIRFPDGYASLSDLFSSDISVNSAKWYFDVIDRVLTGSSNFEQFRGNACRLEIYSDTTHVINYLFENLEDSHLYCFKCSLPTVLLKELIQIWLIELERFTMGNQSN